MYAFQKDDNWPVDLLTDFNTAFALAVNSTYENNNRNKTKQKYIKNKPTDSFHSNTWQKR